MAWNHKTILLKLTLMRCLAAKKILTVLILTSVYQFGRLQTFDVMVAQTNQTIQEIVGKRAGAKALEFGSGKVHSGLHLRNSVVPRNSLELL